jgi:hypothetical protein
MVPATGFRDRVRPLLWGGSFAEGKASGDPVFPGRLDEIFGAQRVVYLQKAHPSVRKCSGFDIDPKNAPHPSGNA